MAEGTVSAELIVKDVDGECTLIDAAIAGDVQAFASLYDRYVDKVHRHIYYRVGNRADAEDLTQQVFLRAWQAIGRYRRSAAPFIAWLLTIAHHLVVNFRRQHRTVEPLDDGFAAGQRWTNPEAETLSKYDYLALRRAILRLKPERQQVVVMRFVEDMDYADIAAALGKSEGNVRVIQHRALAELRGLLAHEVKV